MSRTISSRQAAIIASVLLFANKILVLPSLLYDYVRADGLFVMLMVMLVEIGILFVFFKVKRSFPEMKLYEIISAKMGKFWAKLFYFLIMVYILYKILLVYNVSYMYFRMQVYVDATFVIFVFVFMIIMNSSVLRGLRPLARGIEFFYLFIMVCFIFCLLLSSANFEKLPIFFDSNPAQFFLTGFKHLFCFGDFLCLFVIMDKIKLDKKGEMRILKYVGITMILLLALYFMFYSVFNHTSFAHKNALSDIITFSYRYTDIGRLDIVAIITVMFLSFLQLSIGAYIFSECFVCIFPKLSFVYSVIVFDILFVTLILTSAVDYLNVITIGTDIIPYFAIVLQYVLPLILLIFTKGRKKNEASP